MIQSGTREPDRITEVLVSSHQHKVTAVLNNQVADDAKEDMDISQDISMEIAGKVNSLVQDMLDLLSSEGSLEADTKEQLLLEHSEKYTALVRDHRSFKEDQVRKIKHLMAKKMRDRRQKQHTRQQSKKAQVRLALRLNCYNSSTTGLVKLSRKVNNVYMSYDITHCLMFLLLFQVDATLTKDESEGKITAEAKNKHLVELDAQHKLEDDTLSSQLKAETSLQTSKVSTQNDKQMVDNLSQCAVDSVEQVRL